jgi:putative lipoprotein
VIKYGAICLVLLLVAGAAGSSRASEQNNTSRAQKDEWLSEDKLLHVLTSAYLVGFSYRAYHGEFDNPPHNSRVFAISVTAVAGLGKEVYDLRSPNQTPSWKDIVADAAGIALGVVLFTYID